MKIHGAWMLDLLLLGGIASCLAGCPSPHLERKAASAQAEAAQAEAAQAEAALPPMTPAAARAFVKEINPARQHIGVYSLDNFSREYFDSAKRIAKSLAETDQFRFRTILLSKSELVFICVDARIVLRVRLSQLKDVRYHEPFLEFDGLKRDMAPDRDAVLYISDPEFGRQVAAAIAGLKEPTAEETLEEEAGFDRAVKDFQSGAAEPEFTEDVRRFKVQAENALREKRYGDAVILYQKGLELAPWWAEGHFNRAMMLGEIRTFAEAVFEMKRYLKLAPKAANARAAQDKIYEWEAKAE